MYYNVYAGWLGHKCQTTNLFHILIKLLIWVNFPDQILQFLLTKDLI